MTTPPSTEPGSPVDDPGRGAVDGRSAALRELERMSRGTLVERMGIEIVEAAPDRLVATMPVAGNTQPYGLLHGGASVVLAETLGSIGASLHAGAGRVAVGLDINASHHRAVRSGTVTGIATALQKGSTVVSYQVEVFDDEDRRVCTARITCLLREAR